ncbi:MAG: hypothetical protein J6D03_03270 [Clostridia bacterium]|nr:hypothetical protein [Clostridia bacterium]
MKSYIYKKEIYDADDNLIDRLNEYGNKGWRCINISKIIRDVVNYFGDVEKDVFLGYEVIFEFCDDISGSMKWQ